MSTAVEASSFHAVAEMALKLSQRDRLELAARLLDNNADEAEAQSCAAAGDAAPAESDAAFLARADVQEALRRLDDLRSGRVAPLSMEAYYAIIDESCRPRRVS